MHLLPKPEIVRRLFDANSQLPAMELRWDQENPAFSEHVWRLPNSVCLTGPAPHTFGLAVRRQQANGYQLRVLWNGLNLSWDQLTRTQIMASSLAAILGALGIDLFHLLDQPIAEMPMPAFCAA